MGLCSGIVNGENKLAGLSVRVLTLCLLSAVGLVGCGGGGGDPDTPVAQPITVIVPSLTPQYTFTVESDIVYGQGEIDGGGSFDDLLLDLYIPDELTQADVKQFPLMLMMHGGFFEYGSKSDSDVVASAQEYASRGWLVASINYRLQSDDPVPSSRVQPLYDAVGGASATLLERTVVAAVDDVISALDFMEARDDVYMPWTTVWGFSAGAYLALISGYSLDDYGMEPVGVAAVIDYAGSISDAYIGTPFDDPAGSDPVLMVIHGTADSVVLFDNATEIQTLAVAAGLPHDFQAVDGAGHVIDLFNTNASTGATLFQRSVDYLHETVFAGQNPGPLFIQ